MKKKFDASILPLMAAALLLPSVSNAADISRYDKAARPPIVLTDMGSLMFAGKTDTDEEGNTFHYDHGYAQYFIPQSSHSLPVVMWHGGGQSGKSWETTPDGRDGFWQMFTRAHWPVFIIDQPRRGRAGRTEPASAVSDIPTDHKESIAWNTFRLGKWLPPQKPVFFSDSQFPQNERAIEQFLRWQTPNTGPEPSPDIQERQFMAKSMTALLKQTGPAILMTHSLSGQYGWETAMESPKLVRSIIAFEPGAFAFPSNDLPKNVKISLSFVGKATAPQVVSPERFRALTAIPVMVIIGDNVVRSESASFGEELWRVNEIRARQFVDTLNRHGGQATLFILPEHGIHGNTHFAFADKNNQQIADIVENFLHSRGLDSTHQYHFQQNLQ
ncbi:TPA: alpha/beta fold hydrolase [Klebsiella pneumoniae]|uniref:alpha/beta hydrolase n=1 Tax=Klebsiella pneumoniae TaxID=573 RepID=UPI002ACB761B|nr:alpha/beta fold hydrolase [Klebsiella pneumoniae]HDK5752831.1 alpha/beta fold hydrolase [Klebsiella pneumoniae]HEN4937903.1 alpha/beta fold hydrolase [Klebsiella pneumoniae]